jgi:hypothetical protein
MDGQRLAVWWEREGGGAAHRREADEPTSIWPHGVDVAGAALVPGGLAHEEDSPVGRLGGEEVVARSLGDLLAVAPVGVDHADVGRGYLYPSARAHAEDFVAVWKPRSCPRAVVVFATIATVRHFNRYRLRNEDFDFSDLLGGACE